MTRTIPLTFIFTAFLNAQTVPPQTVPPNRAVALPLSGRSQAGGVATIQTPLPGGGVQSVNTINSTIQVQGAYQGSVPAEGTAGPLLQLSLD